MNRGIFCDTCGYVDCVCEIIKTHEPNCHLRVSMCCPVGVECEHGYDFCPQCDLCTCAEIRAAMCSCKRLNEDGICRQCGADRRGL